MPTVAMPTVAMPTGAMPTGAMPTVAMPTGEVAAHLALQTGSYRGKSKHDSLGSSSSLVKPVVSDKTNYFGIEVVSKLTWKPWQPGREYTKTLVLKNLNTKTLKLSYKIPETRFFSTLYPKQIFLSVGSSFSLPVTFRPLESVQYRDKITFMLKDGEEFEIPLQAVLPQIDINLPSNLDFKMCAVQDCIFILFDVFNTGDVDTTVRWEVAEPFSVEPVEAELKHHCCMQFRASFKPTAAFVYEVAAMCRFGQELEFAGQTTFFGVGKFPHLLLVCSGRSLEMDKMAVHETEVDFGNVAVSFTASMNVEIHNLSPVQTPFHIEKVAGMNRLETVFQCTETDGIVPPMSFVKISLIYCPMTVHMTSIDYFSVTSMGGISHSIIKCVGTAIGPSVELSKQCINFKQVDFGQSCVKQFDMINNSDVEAVYQFVLDSQESVFKFPQTSGVIAARTRQIVSLKFVPQQPISYYRRVAFLVHNQPPLYLDILGTCHSDVTKPAILCHHHLTRYWAHVQRGLSTIAPENLNELVKAGRLKVDQNGFLFAVFPEDKVSLTTNPNPQDILPADEYFCDGIHSELVIVPQHVSLDIKELDFGNVPIMKKLEQKTVNITNHTRGKVTAHWMGDSSHIFSVSPSNQDIPPLKSCSFRVTFRPDAPNQLYGNELECFVFYKSMRDYQLVNDRTQCPPWCLTVQCLGHSFNRNNDTFLPRLVTEPNVLVFPAVNVGEIAYQTLLLGNTGDTPILYDFTQNPDDQEQAKIRCTDIQEKSMFQIKPRKGLIKSGCYQIITVKMSPIVITRFSSDLLLRLNDLEKYDQTVHLCGSAEVAEIVLDSGGNMYFKPTCAGTSSSRTFSFKNISRINLRFQWKINKDDEKYLQVEPSGGIVQPNESVSQVWTFTPIEEKKYVIKANLIAWGQGPNSSASCGGKKECFTLRVIGEGSYGDLQCDGRLLDLGDILVGSSASCPINIYNNSNCSLHFRLIIDRLDKDDSTDRSTTSLQGTDVEFDKMEGNVPARGKLSITATIRPMKRQQYQFAVSYQLVIPNSKVTNPTVVEPQHLLQLLATGVYPSITATDIQSQGSAVGISKKMLWDLFSLNNLNTYLNSDPQTSELLQKMSTHHRNSSQIRVTSDFNFSAAPVGSEPCVITIMFQNNRTVLCEWSFLLPKDIQIDMGHWTESGDCNQDELHEMKVIDNKLFDVSPRRGTLMPGESVSVTLTYLHTSPGTNHLNVLFKIARGRTVMLNFIGVTVEPDRPYIHFSSSKHSFVPVPIGEKNSPKQIYDLYNGGAVSVTFECDLTPLDIINRENFDQPIFQCLTPTGTIQPGQSLAMEWKFSPLEAKTYMVDIPIHTQDGVPAIITFYGVGFDQRLLGDTMPYSDGNNINGIPHVQSAELPGQLGYLSMDRMSFGNLPLFSQSRRMIFVTNKSRDRSIFFEWHVTSAGYSKFLRVYPTLGRIGPGEFKMCRVAFLAVDIPAFHDLDLVCEISDLLEYTNYRRELAAWEAEYEKQLDEFTITEYDLNADMKTPDVVNFVGGPLNERLSKLEALVDSGRSEMSRYKTLPPIKQLTVFDQQEMHRKCLKKLSQLWQKPLPQKPFMLHLGVTARTHDHHNFQMNFPEEFAHFYIDRILSQNFRDRNLPQEKQKQATPEPVICSLAESNIVSAVLASCLRGLLEDALFIQAVQKVMNEPVPYFCQLLDLQQQDVACESTNLTNGDDMQNSPKAEEELDFGMEEEESQEILQLSEAATNSKVEKSSATIMEEQSNSIYDMTSHQATSTKFYMLPEDQLRLETEAMLQKETQAVKKLAEFGNAVEKVLENTLLNLMYEALTSEFSIVSRPRLIAMPQRRLTIIVSDPDIQ